MLEEAAQTSGLAVKLHGTSDVDAPPAMFKTLNKNNVNIGTNYSDRMVGWISSINKSSIFVILFMIFQMMF